MKPTSCLPFLFALLTALLCAAQAWALDPARSIAQYVHTKWTTADGAPDGIRAIVQSPDGYLWLGTASGLYRFDGVTFERIPPIEGDTSRSEAVVALLAVPSGDVWVGYNWGGIAVFHDGKLHDFNHGKPEGSVHAFARDADGGVWVEQSPSPVRLSRYLNGTWQSFDIGTAPFRQILALHDGTIWIVTQDSMLVLRHGATRFERVGDGPSLLALDGFYSPDVGLAEDSQGRPWISDCRGIRLLTSEQESRGSGKVPRAPGPCLKGASIPRTIIFDRDDNIWGASIADGIFRLRHPGPAAGSVTAFPPDSGEHFSAADGLSSIRANGIVEDREGDIWLAGAGGVDRFRATNVVVETAIAAPAKGSYIAVRESAGTIDVTDGHTLYQIQPGANPVSAPDVVPDSVRTFCKENDGKILAASSTGALFVLENGRFKDYAGPIEPQPASYIACAIDKYGARWFSAPPRGVFRFDGKALSEVNVFQDEPHIASDLMTLDEQGRLLLYFGGRRSLVRIDGDQIETLVTAKDTQVGLIRIIASDAHYVLLAGDTGLSQINGDRIRTLSSLQYPWLKGISSISQTGRGETWLLGFDGIIRLATADLERAFDTPGSPLRYELFDANDGLSTIPTLIDTEYDNAPGSLEGGDGRLWFMTIDHVVWIDPAHLKRNPLPPPVSIQRLVANDSHYAVPLTAALPKGVSRLEIDYTALSLSLPQRVRFLYRLDGVDDDWVDPGARRQAFYTNLQPGHYRFTVIAANNDGVWNRTGATLAFDIPPTFLQSRLFLALSIALGLGLAWVLYSLRLRQMAVRIRGRLEDRLAERERIARELHDTLLQGFQGLLLRFQAVANQIPAEHPTRGQMEEALERAEDVLVEGRDRVRNLRAAQAAGELSQMLANAAERLEFDPQVSLRVIVEGAPRDLHPAICDEIVAIGKEALFNIARHAHAKAVEINIRYDSNRLGVRFSDDGVGIDEAVLARGREGHFGLTGMRERAVKIRASFVISSRIGGGTEIELAVPANVAYARMGKSPWFRLLRQPRTAREPA